MTRKNTYNANKQAAAKQKRIRAQIQAASQFFHFPEDSPTLPTQPFITNTADVEAILDSVGCNPIYELSKMAMDKNAPEYTRIAALKELAKYVKPTKSAVKSDVNTNEDKQIQVIFDLGKKDDEA